MTDKWTCQIPAYCKERTLPEPRCPQCNKTTTSCNCTEGAEFEFVSDQSKGE